MDSPKKITPKILITWGLGYVGSHIAVVFAQAGYDVVIVDNMVNSHLENLGKIQEITNKKINFYDIDIRNYQALSKVIEENSDIEGIIHCAAKKAISESCQQPFLYYHTNIQGTINLLKAMESHKVKNIIFASSANVYDTKNSIPPFSEHDELNPINPYGTCNLVNERLLKDMSKHKDFNVIIMRYFNPIGAHHSGKLWQNAKGITSNLITFIFKVAKWEFEQLKIFGNDYTTKDKTWIRDYVHIMDLAEVHLLALQYIKEFISFKQENYWEKNWLYDIFNISLGTWTSVKEIIELAQKVTEIKIPYKITKRRPGDVGTLIWNPQKARQVLWRSPKRSIYQALEDAWKFEKRNN